MRNLQPELVLMDIQLVGDTDGIEAAQQVQALYHLPVVFLTAHADPATLNRAVRSQPFGYIVKPFENHDLTTSIEIALSRHQAEQAIRRSLQREKELYDLKSQFIAVVSHEFRNPLGVIQFALDFLGEHGSEISPDRQKLYIQRAKDSISQMTELLEEVLMIGESEAGQLQCHPTAVNLRRFCQYLVEEFRQSIHAEQNVVYEFHTDSLAAAQTVTQTVPQTERSSSSSSMDEPRPDSLFHNVDPKLLRHILVNLLSNAVKYSPASSTVHFDVFVQPEQLIFQIQDSGIGIPVADQPLVFSPFHRCNNARKVRGTGLGLSIVKQCVEAHNGIIQVSSQEGVGTTFTVTLAVTPLAASPSMAQ